MDDKIIVELDAKQKEIEKRQIEAKEKTKTDGIKLLLANILRETVKMAGEFKVNGTILEDERISKILFEGADALDKLNHNIAEYLGTL